MEHQKEFYQGKGTKKSKKSKKSFKQRIWETTEKGL